MATFNKITIVGYLGRDPELKYTTSGDAVCNFSVATSERGKDAEGNPVENSTWFKITLWRRQAEVADQYLRKGSQVYIEGKLRLQTYTDREGNTRASLEVTGSDLQFIGTRATTEGESTEIREYEGNTPSKAFSVVKNKPQQERLPQDMSQGGDASGMLDEDEIPF
jgi:single-strand DNA-binding protein